MNATKIVGIVGLIAILLPSLCTHAQPQPKEPTPAKQLKDLTNQCRKDIQSSDLETRRRAMDGFFELSKELASVVEQMNIRLNDQDDEIRLKAVVGLRLL